MTLEEKLLRAIFGEKASDVRDTSLRLPPGGTGTVVEVRVFSRRGVDKDERTLAIEREEIERLAKDRDDELAILERSFSQRVCDLLLNQTILSGPKECKKGGRVTQSILDLLSARQLSQIVVKNDKVMADLEVTKQQFLESENRLQARFEDKVDKVEGGDELPPGVMKMVKVFVAVKRKLQPGDKMAGRHGNKGVISHHSNGGYALPRRRHTSRRRVEPARGALKNECWTNFRDPSGLGFSGCRTTDWIHVR